VSVILSPLEVRELAGGYRQPSRQLAVLLKLGYWRARRSKVTGEVIVERAHYDAVSGGQDAAPAHRPQVRPQLRAVK
jgi:hypothetical protein